MNAPFARFLRELKERSGRSYAELSKRALTSRSTLHRYCRGYSLPPDLETVIRVGKACDASVTEIRELLEVWIQTDRSGLAAGAAAAATTAAATATVGDAVSVTATNSTAQDAAPRDRFREVFAITNRARSPHSLGRRAGAAALGMAISLTILSASAVDPRRERASPAAEPPITAPSWAVYPEPVEPAVVRGDDQL